MSGAEIRKNMIESGWHSQDRYTTMGWDVFGKKWGYTIWFERWDWHGVQLGVKVAFHCSTDEPDKIEMCIKKAAQKALDAWEKYTDSVPAQFADGLVEENILATKFFKERKLQHLKSLF